MKRRRYDICGEMPGTACGGIRPRVGERGIALVMVLIFSAMALAIMAALVYMLTSGAQLSGAHKRYKTALAAGKGGVQVSYNMIEHRGTLSLPDINLGIQNNTCLTDKLNKSTADWTNCGTGTDSTSSFIDPGSSSTYDWSMQLSGGGQDYNVYAKIVDTVEGNSAGDIGLEKGGVVDTNSGEIQVMSRPYLYTLEVDSQGADNPSERSRLSILYQY